MTDQPISFSLLRLSKPDLVVETPIKLNLEKDIRLDDLLSLNDDERNRLVGEEGFSDRIHLSTASELSGLNGWIQLPQNIGQVYLGEQFSCYISAWNNTDRPIESLEITVEMVTSRARTLLFENRETPIEIMEPDQRKEFAIHYDVKDVGEHSLKCLVAFASNSRERISLPLQLFKFSAKSPVVIRTKVRSLGNRSCLLEACLESSKEDEPLILDYVRFDPLHHFLCTPVLVEQEIVQEGPLKDYINHMAMKVMSTPHCSRNFLFRLDPVRGIGGEESKTDYRELGKLEIKWRSRLGSVGRLQTQQIQGLQVASMSREVSGKIVSIQPQTIALHQPFEVVIRIENETERVLGPLLLKFQGDNETERMKEGSAIRILGIDVLDVKALERRASSDVTLSMVALKSGIQAIQSLEIVDKAQKSTLGLVDAHEVFVSK
eukprot:g5770.t1